MVINNSPQRWFYVVVNPSGVILFDVGMYIPSISLMSFGSVIEVSFIKMYA